jgi:CheY-like chemotaxis protein
MEAGPPNPALEQSGIGVGSTPATVSSKFDLPRPAPLFEIEGKQPEVSHSLAGMERLAELLSGLVNQSASGAAALAGARPPGYSRKALVCVLAENRERVARGLAEDGYQVFVAEDTRQAVDRMRENKLEVVLLDPRFDQAEQGAVYVTREVNILRPVQRRRVFFALLTPTVRSLDAHAAFLSNVNAVINLKELEDLPRLLERKIREFNELYKEFNSALGLPAL